ncbi:hypothetical protein CROQUDRAFT_667319 [Cronartium quercuum f. sp. fusiforme G11]|uniref:Uncharacterized protein n=1 Tax=Cronartium quercuum f. sp. fusiforme G11 TaxID=708437 RepID=A0A9P6NYH3_9BASI|nr:hypothetical protein CROQUDRAFT_667319 [Cronartium quercuum f. sp. fusiforme G11]
MQKIRAVRKRPLFDLRLLGLLLTYWLIQLEFSVHASPMMRWRGGIGVLTKGSEWRPRPLLPITDPYKFKELPGSETLLQKLGKPFTALWSKEKPGKKAQRPALSLRRKTHSPKEYSKKRAFRWLVSLYSNFHKPRAIRYIQTSFKRAKRFLSEVLKAFRQLVHEIKMNLREGRFPKKNVTKAH